MSFPSRPHLFLPAFYVGLYARFEADGRESLALTHAARAPKRLAVIAAVNVVYAHPAGTPTGRVDEFAAADVHAHMGDTRRYGMEKYQVARLHAALVHMAAHAELRPRRVGQRNALAPYRCIVNPEQSKPPGRSPPHTYGVPRYPYAVRTMSLPASGASASPDAAW